MKLKKLFIIALSRLLQGAGLGMFIDGLLFGLLFAFFSDLAFKMWLVLFCLLIVVLGLCLYGFAIRRIYDDFENYE